MAEGRRCYCGTAHASNALHSWEAPSCGWCIDCACCVLHGALCIASRTRRTHQGVQVVLTEGHELIENMKEDNQKLIGILRLKDSEKKALLAQMQEQAPSTHHHNACARAHLAGQTR